MPIVEFGRTQTTQRFELPALIPKGQRDTTIFRYACSLRALGVEECELRAAVEEANATRCQPPLSDYEVDKKVKQALGYAPGHGSGTVRQHDYAQTVRRKRGARRSHRRGNPSLLPDASKCLDTLSQARAWIDSLFFPEDVVCLCFDKATRFPATEWYAYAGQLLDAGDPMLEMLLSQAKQHVGLYAVQNPIGGCGGSRKDANVSDLRWALVECDELPPDKQLERMCALLFEPEDTGWKCKAITWSGNKSYHAIVYVGARSRDEYDSKVDDLYAFCDANGLPVDHSCRNPARLTRMPGVRRGDQAQVLRWCDTCRTYLA